MNQAVFAQIRQEIEQHPVLLFMKGTPVFPQCGFSATVVGMLGELEIPFKSINVLEEMDIREGIKAYSDWPTIPQLYVKGEFVGGCDILREMHQSGELHQLFLKANLLTENHA